MQTTIPEPFSVVYILFLLLFFNQAMVHELLGLDNNRVSLKGSPGKCYFPDAMWRLPLILDCN